MSHEDPRPMDEMPARQEQTVPLQAVGGYHEPGWLVSHISLVLAHGIVSDQEWPATWVQPVED